MHFSPSALLVPVLLVGLAPLVSAQSPLGEIAQKEAERRKAVKSDGRVYTNSDLPNMGSPIASPTPQAPATPAVADASEPPSSEPVPGSVSPAAPAPEAEVRDRAYWSGRQAALRETFDRNQTLLDALQSRINALTTDFVNRDDPAQRAVIATDRDRAMAELERLRKQVVADQKSLDDFAGEARRASVPPGWLR